MESKKKYEVQTQFTYGWENVWSEDDKLLYFITEQEAEDAISEFFADLSRAGITQSYDREEYRVVQVTDAVSHKRRSTDA